MKKVRSNSGDLRARPTSSRSRPLLFLVDSSSPSRPSSTKSPSPPARTRSRLVDAPRCTTPPEAASAAAETVSPLPPPSLVPSASRFDLRSLSGKGNPPRDLLPRVSMRAAAGKLPSPRMFLPIRAARGHQSFSTSCFYSHFRGPRVLLAPCTVLGDGI